MTSMEMEQQIAALQQEVAALKAALDATFRELGSSSIFHRQYRAAKPAVEAAVEKAQPAVVTQSAVPTQVEWQEIGREVGAYEPKAALAFAQEMIQKAKAEGAK